MPSQRSFVVNATVRTSAEFAVFARQAARLKRHGRVEMNMSSLSGKDFGEVPREGSPWHEYASYGVGLHKFFPDARLQTFVDRAFVRKNRRLLEGCLAVLRRQKLEACFMLHEPHFLPEPFFEAYPHLRGARVDHPRRSRRDEFAMCYDHPEGREILASMARELGREVPELRTFYVLTNDAGSGFCWNDGLYPGPNGPDQCRGDNTADRIERFVRTIREGTGKKELDIVIVGQFSRNENELVAKAIADPHVFFGHSAKRSLQVGGFVDNPVLGIIEPVGMLEALQRWRNAELQKVYVNFGTNYRRGHELPATAAMVIDILDCFLERPAYGLMGRMKFLRALCADWAGEELADELLEAFVSLHEAFALKQAVFSRFSGNYVGVSMRHINRPLVVMPEKLTPEEEAYFLPHVFNVNQTEARLDYLDWHGGHLQGGVLDELSPWPGIDAVARFRSMLGGIAGTLEKVDRPTRAADVLRRMATSLRIYSCIMRSIHNFYCVQVVRDRNKEKLSGPERIPPKVWTKVGDTDLLLLHEFMRDELDNSAELISLLEGGGLEQLALAATPKLEDTFLLGPDLVDQLRRKMTIMRRHWLDASRYMATPHI